MGIRRDLELLQEFTAADTYLCAVALDLQDLGAKFEVRFTKGGWLAQSGNYAFNAKHCHYRMVSLPPDESESASEPTSEPTIEPTIEPGEEFGPEKFELAEKMCRAGVRFEDRARGSADDWLPMGAIAFRELMRSKSPMVLECHHSRVYRRVPDAVGPATSPLFEVGKRYANGVGDIFEVYTTTASSQSAGVLQPVQACCVVAVSAGMAEGSRHFFTREGWFHGKNKMPEWNLLPGEVQAVSPSSDVTSIAEISVSTDVPDNPTSDLDRRAAESSKDELIQLLLEHERQLLSAGFRLAGEALLSSGENPDLHRPLVLAVVEWSRVAGALVDRSGDGS